MVTDNQVRRLREYMQQERELKKSAMKAASGGGMFRELVNKDKEIRKYLKVTEIDSCFDLGYYTTNVNKVFRRVFGS